MMSIRGPRRPAAVLLRSLATSLMAALTAAACASVPGTGPAHVDAACSEPYTAVGAIQGTGAETPLNGQTVTTVGVVVGDFEGAAPALRGFYIQDVRGDGDPATSDGIFVFNGDRDDVSAGDLVRVTGVAGEAQAQTQLEATAIVRCGVAALVPTDIALPFDSAGYLERYEGMLVRLPQTLHVTEHYQLGRFGEVVLSAGDRLPQPTHLAAPGAAARAVQTANDLNRIVLDDATYAHNPDPIPYGRAGLPLTADNTLRGGDRITGLVGVLTQTSSGGTVGVAYRVRPVAGQADGAPLFVAANPRHPRPPDVGGTLRVASFNLLNYFNTFDGCTGGEGGPPVPCRGAEHATEFERQWRKTVAAIVAMDAHVLGVIELENDGYGAGSAIAHLVAQLNEATAAGRYAFIDVDHATGTVNALGADAIKVGLLFQPARVTPTGRTAVLNSVAFVNAGESLPRNRPALAQAFRQPDGGRVVVSINHLKSKSGACDTPDAGDGQAHCNAARTVGARELVAWLATDPTGTGEARVLLMGDMNAYAREDPITVFRDAGYTDMLDACVGAGAYTYVYNGQWGYLDHVLASPALLPAITGVAAWHINADEPPVLDFNTNFRSDALQRALYAADPFRSSDHDPVIAGLRLPAGGAPGATAGSAIPRRRCVQSGT